MHRPHRLHLSSSNADRWPLGRGRSDAVVFELAEPLMANPGEMLHIRVDDLSVPNARPIVHTANNQLHLDRAGTLSTVTIPLGIYNSASQLRDAVQTALSAASAGLTVTYSSLTNRFTWQNTVASQVTLRGMAAAAAPGNAAELLGIEYDGLVIPALQTIESAQQADLTTARVLEVHLGGGLRLNSQDSRPGNPLGDSVLQSVPITVQYGDIIEYHDMHGTYHETGVQTISTLELRLTDQDDVAFDIGGLRWAATIAVISL